MFIAIISALIVSIDAFFIGLSLGLQKRCKFLYLFIINTVLLGLCVVGFFVAERIYDQIPFEPDYVVGFAFVTLGLWTILQYFMLSHKKHLEDSDYKEPTSIKSIVIIGAVMSIEAMLITMGLVFIFLPQSFFVIALTVWAAHFGYSALSFCLARSKYAARISVKLSHIISGAALIAYGLMTLFLEL